MFPPEDPIPCSSCDAPPGSYHTPGCDVERCPDCGLQHISCSHAGTAREHPRLAWTGKWPGATECEEFGWYAVMNLHGPGWVSCEPGTPGSIPDINRLYKEAKWDPKQARFVLKPPQGVT
jgi:hypothetical protein